MDTDLLLKILIAAAAAGVLGWRISHAYRSERSSRDHLLDGFGQLLAAPRFNKATQGLPEVSGELDGTPVLVSLDADTLALRTLPTLWLVARWAREHMGVVDVLLDQSGTEYFLDDREFDARTAPPEGWPESAVVRVSGAEARPILDALERVDPSAYPALKYVVIDRHELKIRMRCARADRQTYRVLRSATFKPDSITPDLAAQTVAALRAVEDAICEVKHEG